MDAPGGSGSSDADGSISGYQWKFGDGSTGSGATPAHTYANAGSYTAVLTVTDNLGAIGTASVGITVNPALPAINAPSNLTGLAGRGSVTLKWTDNSNNETGFRIERAPSGSTSFATIGTTGANVTTFTENVARKTFVYRVAAFNTTAASSYSNTVSVRSK